MDDIRSNKELPYTLTTTIQKVINEIEIPDGRMGRNTLFYKDYAGLYDAPVSGVYIKISWLAGIVPVGHFFAHRSMFFVERITVWCYYKRGLVGTHEGQ